MQWLTNIQYTDYKMTKAQFQYGGFANEVNDLIFFPFFRHHCIQIMLWRSDRLFFFKSTNIFDFTKG